MLKEYVFFQQEIIDLKMIFKILIAFGFHLRQSVRNKIKEREKLKIATTQLLKFSGKTDRRIEDKL